jgi:hypothetical protein
MNTKENLNTLNRRNTQMNYSEEQIDMTPELFNAVLAAKVSNQELLASYKDDIKKSFEVDSEKHTLELLGSIVFSDYVNTVLLQEINEMKLKEADKQSEINNRVLDILESTTERLDKVSDVVVQLTELTSSLQKQVKTLSGINTFFK